MTADLKTLPGPQYHLVSIYAWTVRRIIEIWALTYLSFVRQILTVSFDSANFCTNAEYMSLPLRTVWQWDQLRTMKVGGNESATKYFKSHGGSAALASKDPKTKYTSNAAKKYKEELARRTAADIAQYGY